MFSGVIIISIDESSFKQESGAKRYWQPSSKTIKQVFKTGKPVTGGNLQQQEIPPVQDYEESKTMDLQTPVKQNSIGLTPVQERLAALRLSSGVRRSPRLANVSMRGRIEVG